MPRRYALRTDANESPIVKQLKMIPGVSVETGHHDLLVGYRGVTYWIEIKTPAQLRKDGEFKRGAKRDSQKALDETWTGHRIYATDVEDILAAIGITSTRRTRTG